MTRVNFESDLKVSVGLTLGGAAIAVPDHDFDLIFMACGVTRYVCSRRGDVWTNCRQEGDRVECFLDNHGLGIGVLRVKYVDLAPDADMADGDLRTVTPSELEIELVTGAGDGVSEVDAEVAADVASAIADCRRAVADADAAVSELSAGIAQVAEYAESAKGQADAASASAANAAESADAASGSAVAAQGSANVASGAADTATQAADTATQAAARATEAESAVLADREMFDEVHELLNVILYGNNS